MKQIKQKKINNKMKEKQNNLLKKKKIKCLQFSFSTFEAMMLLMSVELYSESILTLLVRHSVRLLSSSLSSASESILDLWYLSSCFLASSVYISLILFFDYNFNHFNIFF